MKAGPKDYAEILKQRQPAPDANFGIQVFEKQTQNNEASRSRCGEYRNRRGGTRPRRGQDRVTGAATKQAARRTISEINNVRTRAGITILNRRIMPVGRRRGHGAL